MSAFAHPGGEPGTTLGALLRIRALAGQDICDLRLSLSGNTVVAETAAYVARIGWCAPIHVEREVGIWRAAGRVGLPVPELVGHGEVDGRPYMVYTRLPGWPSSTDRAALRDAGAKLAALHGACVDPFPVVLRSRARRMNRFAMADAFLREHTGRLPGSVVACVRLAEADWASASHTPTHGDYRGPNLLAAGGRVTGVLDWSDARRASREADLGSIDRAGLHGVLDGYLAVAPAPRGAELLGHFAGRHAALAAAGVISAETAIGAVEYCTAELAVRGISIESGD